MSKKVVIALSGGMDSATLLGHFIDQGYEVHCVGFTYGAKHNSYEQKCAKDLADHYGVPFQQIILDQVMVGFKSDLLKTGGEIPEGHYSDASMSATVVPGRNMIFAGILAGLAESIGAGCVGLGVHSGDHAIYPDCRPDFVYAMDLAIQHATGGKVKLEAPFLYMDKTSILDWGIPNNVPYRMTRTCYKDQPKSCGKCGSCVERLEAFFVIGGTDPIKYEVYDD